jgi:hypothetical protein
VLPFPIVGPPERQENIPREIIVMWSGSINDIPPRWLLCDGTNGTPDLSDRFVLGTTNNAEIGDTGGSFSIVLTEPQLAPHSHTGTTNLDGAHQHHGTTDFAGNHSHQYVRPTFTTDLIFSFGAPRTFANNVVSTPTSVDGSHTHTFNTNIDGAHQHAFTTDQAGSGDPIDITNPYYKLAFIMKA